MDNELMNLQTDTYDKVRETMKMPDIVIISNAGFPGENNFETMKVVMKTVNPILEIYRNCGMVLKSKDETIKTNQWLKKRDFVPLNKPNSATNLKLN
jgi:predicted metallo-beta-lactamase superfamily hydrolase